jgi:hypothetical protein
MSVQSSCGTTRIIRNKMCEITIVNHSSLQSDHPYRGLPIDSVPLSLQERYKHSIMIRHHLRKVSNLIGILTFFTLTIERIVKMRDNSTKFLPSILRSRGQVQYLCPSGGSILQGLMTDWDRSRFLHRIRDIARFRCPLWRQTPSHVPAVPVQNWPIPYHHSWILQLDLQGHTATQSIGSIGTINHSGRTIS